MDIISIARDWAGSMLVPSSAWDLVTGCIALAAFFVSLWTFFHHRRQQSLSNFYSVQSRFMEHMDKFEHLHSLKWKPVSEWSVEDRKICYDICAALHDIGMLMHWKYVDARKFIRLWYYSLPIAIELAEPLVEHYRDIRDERYWGGIRVLKRLCRRHLKGFKGFK